jgi:hypothetical protein
MRKIICFLLILLLLVFFSNGTFADTIVGTSGNWQTWTTSVLNENGHPYWDGNSFDSGQPYNIGNYLTNTGGFSGGSVPGVIPYWGMADGTSDKFSFHWLNGSSQGAMKLEVAGYAGSNIFGYHDSSGYHEIFQGSASTGATATFTPTSDYYFYLKSPDGTFTTNMSNGETYQHFAIFQESTGVYWLGMEDLKCNSDYDYNDMVVKISPVPATPEPATLLLMGFGSGVMGAGIRRLKRKFKKTTEAVV